MKHMKSCPSSRISKVIAPQHCLTFLSVFTCLVVHHVSPSLLLQIEFATVALLGTFGKVKVLSNTDRNDIRSYFFTRFFEDVILNTTLESEHSDHGNTRFPCAQYHREQLCLSQSSYCLTF